MRLPPSQNTPTVLERRLLEPVRWPFRGLRNVLIVLAVVSAWLPPPNPLPAIAVIVLWMCIAIPHLVLKVGRSYVIARYGLPAELRRMDAVGVRRMRRMFFVAFVAALVNVPFFIAYAVSRPVLARTAWYWLAEAPATSDPPKGVSLQGLFLVTSMRASMREVTFDLPGGRIILRLNANGDGVDSEWWSIWTDRRR